MRATMKIPAVTMVAAWIRAEMGVGPSMESGSQTWRGNWADFPMAPINRHRQMKVRADHSRPGMGLKLRPAMDSARSNTSR